MNGVMQALFFQAIRNTIPRDRLGERHLIEFSSGKSAMLVTGRQGVDATGPLAQR
jgi:hypothetical protein